MCPSGTQFPLSFSLLHHRISSHCCRRIPWSFTEKETPASSAAAAEAQDEGPDADLRRPDRPQGDEGADPVQAGHHPGPGLPGRPASQEVRPRNAHDVDDANDAGR